MLLEKAAEADSCLSAGEEHRTSRPERVVRAHSFLDSDSDGESVADGDDPTPTQPAAVRAKRELDAYLLAPGGDGQDILTYWREKEAELPLLSNVAKSILAIPASNTSERSFSTAGRVVEERRTRLAANSVDALLFLNSQAKREL